MKKQFLYSILLLVQFNVSAQWEAKSSLPEAVSGRHHPVTFASDNFGYYLTGSNSFSNYTSDFYKYDPINDLWVQMPDFPGIARSFSIGLRSGEKAYMGFGASENDRLTDLWSFDFITEEWTELTACPCAGRTHPAFLASDNGKLYLGLGSSSSANLKDWWEYDIESDHWAKKEDFPDTPRHHPYQFSIGDYQYVGLGHGTSIYSTLYRYDSTTDSWSEMAELPSEGRVAGTQFDYNGKGYVLSGDGDDHLYMDSGEFWEYDPATDVWTSLPPHPGRSRWAPGSFLIDNILYFTSGLDYDKNQFVHDMISFPMSSILSLDDIGLPSSALDIHPNPASESVEISLNGINTTMDCISIYSIDGNKIAEYKNVQSQKQSIDLNEFSNGFYLVTVQNKDNQVTQRLIVSK